MRFTIRKKLFYSHFFAVVLVSGSIGTFFYYSAVDSLFKGLQNRLRSSAALLSRSLDADEIRDIRGPADVNRPEYQKNLHLLREFQDANDDIAFIYIMRKVGDKVVFVIDSDPSPQQALPGRVYTADVPNLRRGFDTLIADKKILCDEWGCFLSGYAPIKNGKGQFLLGMDMDAGAVQQKFRAIRITGILSLCLSLLLAFLFSKFLAERITSPVRVLVRRSKEIADQIFVGEVKADSSDELADLAHAFNIMSRRLSESYQHNRNALADLEEVRASLEARVVVRTARLAELNEQLRQEISVRKRAEGALARAAATDYLTNLLNRRAMTTLLEQEVERVRRSGLESSLILMDIDHFKAFNDRYGHGLGDKVLVHVAGYLKGLLRRQDAVARWGGEEVLILLPQTALAGAMAVAEKVRAGFSDHPFTIDGFTVGITVSMGVSALTAELSIDACIRRADMAMYRAKSEGRNRVVAAGDDDPA